VGRDGPARAIAFDLFHTLVDPEEFRPPTFRRARAVAEQLGIDPGRFERAWAAGLAARQVACRPTVLERVQEYCRTNGVAPPPTVWTEVDDLLGRYQDLAIRNPRPAVIATLDRLRRRGWTLGLISNCDEREIRALPGSELARRFDGVVLSCEVGAAKPSADAFRALIPRWGGVPLEAAIFVGDGSADEIPGAQRAGFARVLFQSGFVATNGLRSAEENERIRAAADAEIGDVAELLAAAPGSPRR
jgi:putative hydrolase of the HAD superfamily